tara:strand:+ start:310 stop:924 length:615 start_codon:yes stop_codon:yes gene_type:complete
MYKHLLIGFFVAFSLATEWSSSVSVRTPNDETKPLDYELSIKLEDKEGKLRYLVKRDWERELGENFIDDILYIQHQVLGNMYYGFDYVNKESKDIDYVTYNLGATIEWFKAGASFKQIDNQVTPLLNIGMSTKAKVVDLDGNPDIEYNVSLSIKSNINETNIINVKSEIKKWITTQVNIFGLYKHEYYNEKEDFQFKVGLGIKL